MQTTPTNPMNALITIPFHNQTIVAIEHDGMPYVAMRPIVENLGLSWVAQYRKITEKFSKGVAIIATPSAGGLQENICLPLSILPGFLYSINASKVKPELRDTIIAYQEECTDVLFNHWMGRHDAQYQAKHQELTAMQQAQFARHPQWRETRDLYRYGFSTKEIAGLQGKHRRNVQRMLACIRKAGFDCRRTPQLTLAA